MLAWLARKKQNILTTQPCLHTLMQTRLSANQSYQSLFYKLKYIQVPPILNFLYGSFSSAWVIYLTVRIISTFVSVKSKLQHAPPGQPPGHLTFLKIIVQIPPTRAKMPFKCSTLGSIQVIKCPHPGDISQAQKWQKDGGNTVSCRTKYL